MLIRQPHGLCQSNTALQYSKKGLVFVAPTWEKGPQVLIPPSMIQWLSHAPTEDLNAKECTFESMQFEYTLGQYFPL